MSENTFIFQESRLTTGLINKIIKVLNQKNTTAQYKIHSGHLGINPPPLKTPAPLFCQSTSQICTLSKTLFLGSPSPIHPLKIGFFSEPP